MRDFAIYIERACFFSSGLPCPNGYDYLELKKQQQMYHNLVQQIQRKLDLEARLADGGAGHPNRLSGLLVSST